MLQVKYSLTHILIHTGINNEVDKMVFVKNKGDYDAYVRSVFAFEAGNYVTVGEFEQMVHLNRNTTDGPGNGCRIRL